MRLGIEARALYVGKRTGIPNYTWNIVSQLKYIIPELELYLYAPSKLGHDALDELDYCKLRQRRSPFGVKGYFWTKFMAPGLINKDSLDVFLAPRTIYPYSLIGRVPVVSIIHDLNHVIYPSVMPLGTLASYRIWLRRDVRRADRLVAVSRGTSLRAEMLLGRKADAIVPPAVSRSLAPASEEEIVGIRAKHGLAGPYLVFVGTLEPRKNLRALLDALKIVNSCRSEPLTLALVGQRGWRNKGLVARLDAGEPNVRELGYVPDRDLPALYSGSIAFVIPSIYEGYGMPAAEARACGTRVVATDIPELHESAGPNATFVEPTAAGIANGIEYSLAQPKPPASRPMTWHESAMILAEVLDDAASSKRRRR